MNKAIPILLVYFLIIYGTEAQTENIFNKENSLKYAQFLIENEDFKGAASEYSRLLQIEPNNDSIRYQTIVLFRFANQVDSSFFYIKTYERKNADFEREYINLLLISDKWKELEAFTLNSTLSSNEKQMAKLHQLMCAGKWRKAQKQLERVEIEQMDKIIRYNQLVEEGIKSPHRNMALAVAMSALVPGLGKIYAGAPWDGLSTLAISGFLAFASYRGFVQKEELSVPGWIFGAGFVGFYAGNIYGTVKQVKKFNNKYKNKLKADVQALVFSSF